MATIIYENESAAAVERMHALLLAENERGFRVRFKSLPVRCYNQIVVPSSNPRLITYDGSDQDLEAHLVAFCQGAEAALRSLLAVADQTLDKPCDECPFLMTSAPGWFGGYNAQETLLTANGEAAFHCHKTRNGRLAQNCAGRLLFALKNGKSFRNPGLAAACKALRESGTLSDWRKAILSVPDFMRHHETAKSEEDEVE